MWALLPCTVPYTTPLLAGVCEIEAGGFSLNTYDGHSRLLLPSTPLILTQLDGPGGEAWFGVTANLLPCPPTTASGRPRLCINTLEVQLNSHTLVVEVKPEVAEVEIFLFLNIC